MVKKLIFINVLLILAVVAATTTVTFAYFSSTRQESFTINTARIGIDETWNFPLKFDNLLPGQPKEQIAALRNTGTTPSDFYLQMDPGQAASQGLCDGTRNALTQMRIEAVDASGTHLADVYSGSLCQLYASDSNPVIPLLSSNVPVNDWRYFRFTLQLDASLSDPNLMGGASNTTTRLIATQHNAPAPLPAAGMLWPEGDPNY